MLLLLLLLLLAFVSHWAGAHPRGVYRWPSVALCHDAPSLRLTARNGVHAALEGGKLLLHRLVRHLLAGLLPPRVVVVAIVIAFAVAVVVVVFAVAAVAVASRPPLAAAAVKGRAGQSREAHAGVRDQRVPAGH